MPTAYSAFDSNDVVFVKKNNSSDNKIVEYPVNEFKRILLDQNDDNVVWDSLFIPI